MNFWPNVFWKKSYKDKERALTITVGALLFVYGLTKGTLPSSDEEGGIALAMTGGEIASELVYCISPSVSDYILDSSLIRGSQVAAYDEGRLTASLPCISRLF